MAYCTVCGTEVSGNFCPKCGKARDTSFNAVPPPPPYSPPRQNTYSQQYTPPPQNPYANNPYAQNYSAQPVNVNAYPASAKDKVVALLLCIFLGVIGVHHFYVGRIGYGILYIFTGGLFGIGWLVDVILIATGSYKDQYGLPLKNTYM